MAKRWVAVLAVTTIIAATGMIIGAPAAAQPTPPASPAAGLGIRILDTPEAQKSDPRNREYIVETAAPGSTITRHVQITNTTGAAQDVQIVTSGATIHGGHFIATGTEQNQLASWTKPSSTAETIADGDSATVAVTISIPSDATRGEQYAVLWAQMHAVATTKTGRVNVVNRVGIREYIDVDTTATPPAFTLGRITATRTKSGTPALNVIATNTGSTAVDLSGRATLTDGPGLTSAGPYQTTASTTLAPSQHSTITIPLPATIADGPWTATLTVSSGNTTRTTTLRLTLPKAHHPSASQAPSTFGIILVLVGAGLLCALGATTLALVIGKRRRTRNS